MCKALFVLEQAWQSYDTANDSDERAVALTILCTNLRYSLPKIRKALEECEDNIQMLKDFEASENGPLIEWN